ncbi:30S ribosomal protein S8 [Candidatus Jorgensenbacteria bacterium]|nr:30S ribosomal protein S8 [Candidatus Jorgensenbacteria bacterium]
MHLDLIIKIKNAQAAKKKIVKTRYNKIDYAVAELLRRCGFLKKVEVKGRSIKKVMEIEFPTDKQLHGVKFLSKPSRHLYGGYRDFKKVKNGLGLLVVSTSHGVLSGQEARKKKVGGELLFEIW